MNKRALRTVLVVVVAVCFGRSVRADQKTLWRIGKFDESSGEFKPGGWAPADASATNGKNDVVYVVGKSKEETDWLAFQPGSASSSAGFRPHPFAIEFDLPGTPRGLYSLKVALLDETPRVPSLQVEVNGHRGLFYQHPRLTYAGGDPGTLFLPTSSADTITFDIPTRFLRSGRNEVVLTAIDAPADGADTTHSGVNYDAIELDQDAGRSFATGGITIRALPTIYYQRREGKLNELVDLFVRANFPAHSGHVVLAVGKNKFTEKLSTDWDFGERLVEFAVPEFGAGTKGEVEINLGGHSRRFGVDLNPAKKWNIFLVPHTHLDVGYTDYQAKVAEVQSRTLDEAIQMIRDHPSFRFTSDGYWCVREFLAGRSEQQQKQLFQMMKDNEIFVPTVEASLLTGFASLETLIRSLYPAFAFHQEHGGNPDYASITDVPSYSWSYASILAAAGLKYFVAGSDNWRGPIILKGRLNEKSPFWWEGPDGGRILMWYSWDFDQVEIVFGMPPQIAPGRDSLPRFLQAYSRPEYTSDGVILYGTQHENTDLVPQQAAIADDWNKIYAFPRLRYSGFSTAVDYIAKQLGDSIPVIRGDGGPYWEDGVISVARTAAVERETEQRALAAEKFSTVGSLLNPRLQPEKDALNRLWNDMVLLDEHTWTADRSVAAPSSQEATNQLAVKEGFGADAKRAVDYVLGRSLASLADLIYDPEGTLLVFNPLSWPRSSLVEMDLYNGQDLVDVATNQPVGYEVLSTNPSRVEGRSNESFRRIRFLAEDVPSVGYKAYLLKRGKSEPTAPQPVAGETLENQYYRITLDRESGSVKGIFDKELNRELVNSSSPYRFDQYLYVTGADQPSNRLVHYTSTSPIPPLSIHGAGNGRLLLVAKESFGVVARLLSSGINTPRIETEIVLFDGQKKIEFINHIDKTEVYTKEGVYFAFPFAMNSPRFRYEIQNGFVDPNRDQLPGAGKEWFSVQHWVAAEQGGITAALVPVDAPLMSLGDIVRGAWPDEFGQRAGTIFSYVMNNYWDTNYSAGQGGKFTFRYVLTSGNNLQPAYLSRLGREEMAPLELDQIVPQDKSTNSPRPLDSSQGSFLQVDQPNVELETWKIAEDGNGTVLRFLELDGKESTVEVRTPFVGVKSGWISDALERKLSPLVTSTDGFRFSIKPFQIVTVRLEAGEGLK